MTRNKNISDPLIDELLEHALKLINMGFKIFSLHSITLDGHCTCNKGSECKDAGKHPISMGGFKNATDDVERVKKIWGRTKQRKNIGIATGHSSELLVIDVDPRHGGDSSITALESKFGVLAATMIVNTGGGGQHYYYQMPEDIDIPSTQNTLGAGIDIRANGGYVVAPGSLHVSGVRYEFR